MGLPHIRPDQEGGVTRTICFVWIYHQMSWTVSRCNLCSFPLYFSCGFPLLLQVTAIFPSCAGQKSFPGYPHWIQFVFVQNKKSCPRQNCCARQKVFVPHEKLSLSHLPGYGLSWIKNCPGHPSPWVPFLHFNWKAHTRFLCFQLIYTASDWYFYLKVWFVCECILFADVEQHKRRVRVVRAQGCEFATGPQCQKIMAKVEMRLDHRRMKMEKHTERSRVHTQQVAMLLERFLEFFWNSFWNTLIIRLEHFWHTLRMLLEHFWMILEC